MKSNPKFPVVLTRKAEADIQDIAQYTFEVWGEDQARIYNSKLFKGIDRIRDNPLIGPARGDLLPGYRTLLVEKHIIVYWPTEQKINIVRILHQSRDIKRHF